MYKNKKGQWMWMVYGALAIGVLVIGIFFIGRGTSSANENLNMFQSCEAKKGGHCEKDPSACESDETSFYKALGCGNEKDEKLKSKPWCCLPSP